MNTPFIKIATIAFASIALTAGAASAQEMRKDQVQDRVQDIVSRQRVAIFLVGTQLR